MNYNNHIVRSISLVLGMIICSFAAVLIIRAQIGIPPWEVLHQGISNHTGISFGRVSMIVGYTVLALGCLLKIFPGPGTIANITIFGIFTDIFLPMIPESSSTLMGVIMNVVGAILFGLGGALYLKPKYGGGPRDALLMGLVHKFKIPIRYVRPVIEAIVLIAGLLLGGNFGPGTFISLFLIGLFYDVFFKMLKFDPKKEKQTNFIDIFHSIKYRNN